MNEIMGYDCDDAKRAENLRTRGVDMMLAATMFEAGGVRLEARDDRRDYGEARFIAVGTALDRKNYAVVFTDRGTTRWIITAWRISDRSERKLRARIAGGTGGDVPRRRPSGDG